MIDELLLNGKLSYHYNILKNGIISKDIMKIEYMTKIHYIMCTFEGIKLINVMLIS